MQQVESRTENICLPVVIDGNLTVFHFVQWLRSAGLRLTQDGKGNLAIANQRGSEQVNVTRGRQTTEVMKLIQRDHAERVQRTIAEMGTAWIVHPNRKAERIPRTLAEIYKPK